jgi:hypothetical protein
MMEEKRVGIGVVPSSSNIENNSVEGSDNNNQPLSDGINSGVGSQTILSPPDGNTNDNSFSTQKVEENMVGNINKRNKNHLKSGRSKSKSSSSRLGACYSRSLTFQSNQKRGNPLFNSSGKGGVLSTDESSFTKNLTNSPKKNQVLEVTSPSSFNRTTCIGDSNSGNDDSEKKECDEKDGVLTSEVKVKPSLAVLNKIKFSIN